MSQTPNPKAHTEFEVHVGGELYATVYAQRHEALQEALRYVGQVTPGSGKVELFEVRRIPVPVPGLTEEGGND